MAAVPASPLDAASAGGLRDWFSFFGLKRRFAVDRAALERRFYDLSRQYHPDRHAAGGVSALNEALLRMSELNEAYRTLKDPALLREHYLRIEGIGSLEAKGSPPAELAESWFDLQDALVEDPGSAPAKLEVFTRQLAERRARGIEEIAGIETRIDEVREAGPDEAPRELLDRLAAAVRAQSYLKSMQRDVERITHGKR